MRWPWVASNYGAVGVLVAVSFYADPAWGAAVLIAAALSGTATARLKVWQAREVDA